MTKVAITQSKLDDLALHISAKSGEAMPLTIQDMQDAVDGIQTGSNPNLQAKTRTISAAGTFVDEPDEGYDGLSSVTTTVPQGDVYVTSTYGFFTENGVRKWRIRSFATVETGDDYGTPGYIADHTTVFSPYSEYNAVPTGTTITPTTSSQTIGGNNYMMEGAATVAAMPSGSVSASATKGTVNNHAISVTPTATVGTAGYLAAGSTNGTAVSVSASELVSGTVTISASGSHDVTNYASASVAAGGATASASKSISGHTATVTPSVTRTAGYVTAGSANGTAVTVSASELVSGSETKTSNGTYDVTNLAELVVNVSGGGGSAQTVTGTFTGNGTRQIDVSCSFEPDIVYFNSDPGTSASSGTVAAIIVRGMMTATRYRNNSTTNSHYAIPGITGMNTAGSSYSWRATYNSSTQKVTLYCFSSGARALLTSNRTYTYTFVKYTS